VSAYLPAVFGGAETEYFNQAQPLTYGPPNEDERAYSQQFEFGDDPFQIMTGDIHGCTTITLVSNRAVWMAHFWETYSNRVRSDPINGDENSDKPPDHPVFVERILMFIRGEEVTNPTSNFNKPYIRPKTPYINPDLFNADNDETKLFISTPIPMGEQLSRRSPLRYPRRVRKIAEAFAQRIGRTPEVNVIPYQALNYDVPEDKRLVGKTARGFHLFQYDPKSDGNNQRAWRYFAEAVYKVKNL